MIRPAFAAWLSKSGRFSEEERSRFAEAADRAKLEPRRVGDGVMIAGTRTTGGPERRIVGSIFRRQAATSPTSDVPATLSADGCGLRDLASNHWGDYVAIGIAREGSYALRAPFGGLPCYWHDANEHVVLASSIRLLSGFGGGTPAVDWQGLAHFLAATDLRTGRTCLHGINELGGGESIHVSARGSRIEPCWSPWPWAEQARAFSTPEAAAETLGTAIDAAVSARVQPDVPVILLLSGGLDSSVVAAALASQTRRVTCLTMAFADAQGDERAYARAVARHLGLPLVEVVRDPCHVDLTHPLAPGLPRPMGAQFRQATFVAIDDLANTSGAVLAIDGGGGDNMFCSVQSVAPVMDAFLAGGGASRPFATGASIARMAHVSLISVLARSALRMLTRGAAYRWPVDRSLLDPAAAVGFVAAHHWLQPPRGTPPGKAAQVGLLLAAAAVLDGLGTVRCLPLLSPLVSQPVAEVALRVPAWMWFEEGRNRVPVRRAFATRLPTSVVDRRSKGTPTGFLAALVEQGADRLRPFLLDGCLAANAVIDRGAVEAALAPGPARDLGFARLLQLADAEAWARSWR